MVLYNNRKSEYLFQTFLVVFFLAFSIIIIYPFLNILAKSFSTGTAMISKPVAIWPVQFTLENYKTIFTNTTLLKAMRISAERTVFGTVGHIFVVSLAAYALSKQYLRGRKILIVILFLIPNYVSGGLVPTYMLITQLRLTNNFLVYILPMLFAPYHFLLMTTFFRQLPDTIEEAAKIDGASDLHVFLKIILPISKPIIATVALFIAVAQWGSWLDALMYVSNQDLFPIQLVLQNIIKGSTGQELLQMARYGIPPTRTFTLTPQSMQMATLCFSIVPILISYPFAQKYFVKGILIGSLKG